MNDAPRGENWKWAVCGMLLLATMLNYMDRLTLNQTADLIKTEFGLNNEQYGLLESYFGVAFATGALIMGFLVDRFNVWWLYPVTLAAWSAIGAATGFVQGYASLLIVRFLLGLAEAGHWPCALRTTQRVLPPHQRSLGNGILQSGAAVGAILTPLVVMGLVHRTGTWRTAFVVVGLLGIFWVIGWFLLLKPRDLALSTLPPSQSNKPDLRLLEVLTDRRFLVLAVVVTMINVTWHYFRVWMPLLLKDRGYDSDEVQWFSSAYYLSTDLGSLAVGFGTMWLIRKGWQVHRSRLFVFGFCVGLTTLSLIVTNLEKGPLLLGMLLVIGFGALGLFPNYYSFTQELTVKHQGMVTGTLGCINWLATALLHWQVGKELDRTKSFAVGLWIAGLAPIIALLALGIFWRSQKEDTVTQ